MGAWQLIARRRGRSVSESSLSGDLSMILKQMNQVFLSAVKRDDFSLRVPNDNLCPCWEIRQCDRQDCEMFGVKGERCWHAARPLCRPEEEFLKMFERTRECEACEVFMRARPDFEHMFIEQFNDLMAVLENRACLLEEARDRVEQSNRLAAIGEFAAGLAHEINNPLDGIMSCTARLEREPENLAQNIEYLHMIREALDRLCNATQQLLEYSRKHDLQCELFDVHAAIENAVAFMGMTARKQAIDIRFDLDDAIPLIQGDRYALTQVFLNLALNAVGAITAASGDARNAQQGDKSVNGEICFRTRTLNADENNGSRVEVSVIDNGIGIEPKNLNRVFEPFFTTKPLGKGTGMGLTVVKRIIEEHYGAIMVESEAGKGTIMRVVLPVKRSEVVSDPA